MMKTPAYLSDRTPAACVECGHLHYYGRPFFGYGVCPVNGCECVGQDDTPYLAERV